MSLILEVNYILLTQVCCRASQRRMVMRSCSNEHFVGILYFKNVKENRGITYVAIRYKVIIAAQVMLRYTKCSESIIPSGMIRVNRLE